MNYKTMPRAELIAELEAWEGKFEGAVQEEVEGRVKEARRVLRKETAHLQLEREELAKLVERFDVSETEEHFIKLARDVHFSKFLTEIELPWWPARFSPRKREMLDFISECKALLERGRKLRRGESQ